MTVFWDCIKIEENKFIGLKYIGGKNIRYYNKFSLLNMYMTGCMGKRVFCDMGGNFEKCNI